MFDSRLLSSHVLGVKNSKKERKRAPNSRKRVFAHLPWLSHKGRSRVSVDIVCPVEPQAAPDAEEVESP